MSKIYILRHSKRDNDGNLTSEGMVLARQAAAQLPPLKRVISSSTARARQTASILSGVEPEIDSRAGYYAPVEDRAKDVSEYTNMHNISFVEAADQIDGGSMAQGIAEQAKAFDDLITEMLEGLSDDASGLIVSHGMTIASAMPLRGLKPSLPDYVAGYYVDADGTVGLYDAR